MENSEHDRHKLFQHYIVVCNDINRKITGPRLSSMRWASEGKFCFAGFRGLFPPFGSICAFFRCEHFKHKGQGFKQEAKPLSLSPTCRDPVTISLCPPSGRRAAVSSGRGSVDPGLVVAEAPRSEAQAVVRGTGQGREQTTAPRSRPGSELAFESRLLGIQLALGSAGPAFQH